MKNANMIFAVCAAAAILIIKNAPAKTTKPSKPPPPGAPRPVVLDPSVDTDGWQYFTDGTAIDKNGTYYYQGQMVWNPMM